MRLSDERGGALMLAVAYLAVMTLAASGFLAMLHYRMGVVRINERMQVCRHLAEAGIEAALETLSANPGAAETTTVLGSGRFRTSMSPGSDPGVYEVTSTGELVDDDVVMESVELTVHVTLDVEGRVQSLAWNSERGR